MSLGHRGPYMKHATSLGHFNTSCRNAAPHHLLRGVVQLPWVQLHNFVAQHYACLILGMRTGSKTSIPAHHSHTSRVSSNKLGRRAAVVEESQTRSTVYASDLRSICSLQGGIRVGQLMMFGKFGLHPTVPSFPDSSPVATTLVMNPVKMASKWSCQSSLHRA